MFECYGNAVLIPITELTNYWQVHPKGVIHVGAHEAEESSHYNAAGWGKVYWVEAQPDKVKFLRNKFKNSTDEVIDAAVWSEAGIPLELHVMTNSASTSLLDLGTHVEAHPDITFSHSIEVRTQVLKDLISQDSKADYLCLDIQGAELEAVKGFNDRLQAMNWIYTEVNREELYKGCCLVGDLDRHLEANGFTRMATRWTEFGWGDALYVHARVKQNLRTFDILKWTLRNCHYYVNRRIRITAKKIVSFLNSKR